MRHFSRYSALARGLFTSTGRQGKKIVVIDIRPTPTARAADTFLQVQAGRDFEALTILRALVKGLPLNGPGKGTGSIAGIPLAAWGELAQLMKTCQYGVVFFGIGLTMSRGRELNTELLLTLVQELNEYTRFYAIPMRGHGNVTGSNHVLTWQTGYPFAVNLSRGYPRYNPGEFSVVDMLGRREVDAALIVATDPGAHLPGAAVEYLRRIPTVVLEPHRNLTTPWARVVIPVSPAGVGVTGTFYRMDNVPLHLKKLVDYPSPSDEEVLRWLKERVARDQNR